MDFNPRRTGKEQREMDQGLVGYSDLTIPERYINAHISLIRDDNAKAILGDYVKKFSILEDSGQGIALFGKPGTGKTYNMAALAKILTSKGVQVKWAPVVDMFNKLLDYRDFKRGEAYFKLKNDLKEAQVLMLDDFGQLRDYVRIRETFFEIVDYRYSWNKPTIFTANFAGDGKLDWKEVAECFNSSLARRVEDMTKGYVYIS